MTSVEDPRRQEILQAAERLLHHYGPQKTTIAEIAREAGIGVGSVYLEFCSKEAIVEELSTVRHRAVFEAMRAAGEAKRATFAERLRAVLDARVAGILGICDKGAHARDLVHCVSPAVKLAQTRFRQDEQALVAEILRRGTHAGEFDVEKPQKTARTVLRAYISFSPPWIFEQPREEVPRLLRSMHDLVLNGLRRRKKAPGLTEA